MAGMRSDTPQSGSGGSRDDEFFQRKRPWSTIKDQVLETYLKPYLTKVKGLRRPILLIDGYAGPGRFGDGSDGSPLIMCRLAESVLGGDYTAFLVNKRREEHEILQRNLAALNLGGEIIPVNGDAQDVILALTPILRDCTVFAYLDSFVTPDFRLVELLVSRDKAFSTEVVVNLNAQEIPRLAAMGSGAQPSRAAEKLNSRLTARLGGDYWRPVYEARDLSSEERLLEIAYRYHSNLSRFLPYTGCCPVRWKSSGRIKYFIVFCSRHPDAAILMNNAMHRAYYQGIHEADTKGWLPGFVDDWRDYRWFVEKPPVDLRTAVLWQVKSSSCKGRKDIWVEIVKEHFMAYDEMDYNEAVRRLVKGAVLKFEDIRGTGKLNDDSILDLA